MAIKDEYVLSVGRNITELRPYRPGKPVEEVQRELGLAEVIKLASNENALGPSPKAVEAICESASSLHLYPDAVCHALREAVSAHLGIPGDHLIFGNGSDDIIHLLGVTYLNPGDEVIMAEPSFVRYEAAAILNRATLHKVPLRDWTHDLRAIAQRITDRTRLIFLCNPNNPTGASFGQAEADRLLEQLPARAIVVMDEAYFEYVQRRDFPDSLRYVREGRNIIVLRTFSKIYGLAGIRLGYGIARPEITGHLDRVREPFNVSLAAQKAGIAALADREHVHRSFRMNADGMRALMDAFERLGLPCAPSDANFLWVDLGRPCVPVFDSLIRQGVIVRTGDIFGAPNHIRVTIGTPEQNGRFLTALEKALRG